jgi:DNA invertase Pin-like site-specific DNA recombinase
MPSTGTMYGYARVAREDQDPALQLEALHAAGVEPANVIQDKGSGAKERPALDKLIAQLGKDDSLMVWKIDRLGRDMIALATLARDMDARGVRLVILTLGLDTATPSGRMVLGIMATLAQFEREQICERSGKLLKPKAWKSMIFLSQAKDLLYARPRWSN